ncbi:MAG: aminoglycoside phosphotransferase family protein [Candidatus Aureabacteria bacterium]|nr:aminoglycoside phosphotransferase family protein [Candidatus Auribacterota bacterium]
MTVPPTQDPSSSTGNGTDHLIEIVNQFALPTGEKVFSPLGNGRIHETYLVEQNPPAPGARFVLQKLNGRVFENPELLMHNFGIVTFFLRQENKKTLELIETHSGKMFYSLDNSVWRMTRYIENTVVYETIEETSLAYEAGKVLGDFHETVRKIPSSDIKAHLRCFHHTPFHYLNLMKAERNPGRTSIDKKRTRDALNFIDERVNLIHSLDHAHQKNVLNSFPCHNDPKLSNILFDAGTTKGICLIDLDTVDIGLLPHDFGDAVRSICNRGGEDETDNHVQFDLKLFEAFTEGYLRIMSKHVDSQNRSYLFTGVKIITLELSIRFLTDYFLGDIYFKTSSPEQNLTNALRQQQLLSQMEKSEEEAERILHSSMTTTAQA